MLERRVPSATSRSWIIVVDVAPGFARSHAQYSRHWPTARVGRRPLVAASSTGPRRRSVGCSRALSRVADSSRCRGSEGGRWCTLGGRSSPCRHQGAGSVSVRPTVASSARSARFAGELSSCGMNSVSSRNAVSSSTRTRRASMCASAPALARTLTPVSPSARPSATLSSCAGVSGWAKTKTVGRQDSAVSSSARAEVRVWGRSARRRSAARWVIRSRPAAESASPTNRGSSRASTHSGAPTTTTSTSSDHGAHASPVRAAARASSARRPCRSVARADSSSTATGVSSARHPSSTVVGAGSSGPRACRGSSA